MPIRKRLIQVLAMIYSLFLLACLTPALALAQPLLVLSSDSSIYQRTANAIQQHYNAPLRKITMAERDNFSAPGTDTLIAIGSKACESVLQSGPAKSQLICTFIPRSTYNQLLYRFEDTSFVDEQRVTAIFLDQPLARQVQLARLIVPTARKVGTFFGPTSRKDRDLFIEAATKHRLFPVFISLRPEDNPVRKLQPIIGKSDVFLPLPDRAIFNRATAKWVLFISLRQRVPLVGFSKKYVEAGALAAVYSTPEQIGNQTAEQLARLNTDGYLPPPRYPAEFSISINHVTAETLGIPVPTASILEQQLKETEQ